MNGDSANALLLGATLGRLEAKADYINRKLSSICARLERIEHAMRMPSPPPSMPSARMIDRMESTDIRQIIQVIVLAGLLILTVTMQADLTPLKGLIGLLTP